LQTAGTEEGLAEGAAEGAARREGTLDASAALPPDAVLRLEDYLTTQVCTCASTHAD